MRNRLITVLLSVVVAGVAVTAVALYVGGVEKKSLRGMKTKSVLITSRSLPAGMSGNEVLETGSFEVEKVPVRYVLPGAVTSPEDIAGLVLADDVASGEQITSQRFRESVQDAFLSKFPKGTEALSLPMEYVRGVAGHLKAGDRVNAYVTAEANDAAARYLQKAGIPSSARVFDASESGATLQLLSNIPVQEVHNPEASTGGSLAASGAVGDMTLAVKPEEAALLVHAQEKAKLWFTLVPQEEG